MRNFNGKVCVVTGAASGIGAACAKALAAEGAELRLRSTAAIWRSDSWPYRAMLPSRELAKLLQPALFWIQSVTGLGSESRLVYDIFYSLFNKVKGH